MLSRPIQNENPNDLTYIRNIIGEEEYKEEEKSDIRNLSVIRKSKCTSSTDKIEELIELAKKYIKKRT